jgi:hypothetical protein
MNQISTPKTTEVKNDKNSENTVNQPSEHTIRLIMNYSKSLEIRKTSGNLTIEHILN